MKRLGLVLALIVAMAMPGCGSDAAPAPAADTPEGATFNDTDVMYLQMMLAHYQPGAEMIKAGRVRQVRDEVAMLAAAIEATEADEARTMANLLHTWDQPDVPATDPILHADHGGLPGDGETEIATLANASDADFEATFLNLLIGYQHRAVELAQMQLAGGINPEVNKLALRIADSRRAQIAHMLKLIA